MLFKILYAVLFFKNIIRKCSTFKNLIQFSKVSLRSKFFQRMQNLFMSYFKIEAITRINVLQITLEEGINTNKNNEQWISFK